jgi:predicted nucleic acid-binding protein
MIILLLLDTNILGQLCHPNRKVNKPVLDWFECIITQPELFKVYVPAIADYELRRKLLHLIKKKQASEKSLKRLEELIEKTNYLPLTDQTLFKAAELWAEARLSGLPTASLDSLDGDVILAAQAVEIGGIVVTYNRKHLSRFVTAKGWDEIEVPESKEETKETSMGH